LIVIDRLRLAATSVALCLATAAHAEDYSAVAVAHNSMGQTRNIKIFVSHGKVRVEPQGAPSFELLDTAKREGYFVVPAQKMYLVQPPDVALHNGAPYSVSVNPCEKISDRLNLATCKKLGADRINGRVTEKWQVSEGDAKEMFTTTIWVDRGLDAIVKSQSSRGLLELQNLHIGPQPANLFVLPAGYAMQKPTLEEPGGPSPSKG
jgi:hypothetical protein